MHKLELISRGRDNGVETVLRYITARGTEILCLGVPLSYEPEGDWDLGPTWCYVINKDPLTLIDTGQWGKYDVLTALLVKAGIDRTKIKRVIITHGHEDHDGNLAEVVADSGAQVCGHFAYGSMISYHPDMHDGAPRPDLPGSCRICAMPEEFNQNCIPYLQRRSKVQPDYLIRDSGSFDKDFRFICCPGHSPDSVTTVFEEEVVFAGDTILPTITPHPSLLSEYPFQKNIMPAEYGDGNTYYGLAVYIRSLRLLQKMTRDTKILLPGHRLFEKGEINHLHPVSRAAGIIDFHEERCGKILDILSDKVLGLDEISSVLFPGRLLKGWGRLASQREVKSHLELMDVYGGIEWTDDKKYKCRQKGARNYKEFFKQVRSASD